MVDRSKHVESTADSFEALLRGAYAPPASGRVLLASGSKLVGGRFEIVARVGEGGMGVVYEAFDAERRATVALKTLSRLNAGGIYRLKNEFRALADVAHPNLVRLHELFAEGALWFFSMDLVPGVRFDQWVRPGGAWDEGRLRSALPQLTSAVLAIHGAGKLHRDLKPSNVLVTPEGAVVVLDFGLASDPELGGVGQTIADESVSGTPAYMAPEQAAGQQAVAASDFYAIGVMLYEALTGKLPFDGQTTAEMLVAKRTQAAPLASQASPDAPADLVTLCFELLALDPAARPTPASLAARLGQVEPARNSEAPRFKAASARESLLGRAAELAHLNAAYGAMLAGKPVVMFVSGESGMGKSALVAAFLDELSGQGHAAVLAGRCYERESLPFKGFDSLVDDLSRFLRRASAAEAAALMPREVFALARLFPVLDRVDAVATSPKKEIPDPLELRRRAFAAFGELMARIRDRRPLVLYIDDAQWLDSDSVTFLRALLVHGQPVPGLAILAHRSEAAEHNGLLQSVIEAARSNSQVDVRALSVDPLSDDAAQARAARWSGIPDAALASSVAFGAGGSPFFVAELARYAARTHGRALSQVSLASALADRLAALAPECRRLLEVIALAGSPLPMPVAVDAASSSRADLDTLRSEHLLRTSSGEALATVECYHDRIRETVTAALSDAVCSERYISLARVLATRPETDPELLARCLEGAGQPALAAVHAERAGDKAASATAFDHAALLYDKALALAQLEPAARYALSIKLADALADAGRGPEAAAIYQGCARVVTGAESIDLRRKAAEELLTCGELSGEALLRDTCKEVGLTIAASSGRALLSLAYTQLRLRFAKLDAEPRRRGQLTDAVRLRLDCARSAVRGMVSHAPIIAASIADQWLLGALQARDPDHLAEALAMQLYFHSLTSPQNAQRLAALTSAAERALDERSPPAVRAYVLLSITLSEFNRGRWTSGRNHAARTLELQRGHCQGVSWEIDVAIVFDQGGAWFRGDFLDIARVAPSAIEDAYRRGRVWIAAVLNLFALPARLIHDDVRGTGIQIDEAAKRWVPQPELMWVDYALVLAEAWLSLYRGDAARAHAQAGVREAGLRSSLLVHAAVFRVLYLSVRGGSAVAWLRVAPGEREALRVAQRCHRELTRERSPQAAPFAQAIAAGLALASGRTEDAAMRLRAAVSGFDQCEMYAYAASARRRLGQLLGGSEEGGSLLAVGDAALHERGVTKLEAMTEMLCPGCRAGSSAP